MLSTRNDRNNIFIDPSILKPAGIQQKEFTMSLTPGHATNTSIAADPIDANPGHWKIPLSFMFSSILSGNLNKQIFRVLQTAQFPFRIHDCGRTGSDAILDGFTQ